MKPRNLCTIIDSRLRHRNGETFCDPCIAKLMGMEDLPSIRRATLEVSRMFRGNDYSRYRGRCTTCGNATVVTAPNRLVWA